MASAMTSIGLDSGKIVAAAGAMLACLWLQVEAASHRVVSAGEAFRGIEQPFGITGLVHYRGGLYAGSNVGLLELGAGEIRRVYQWSRDDPVVGGPWLDESTDRLWVWLSDQSEFAVLDGKNWERVKLPKPGRGGHFTRGDMLEGFHCVSCTNSLWLRGAMRAWLWDTAGRGWKELTDRPPNKPRRGDSVPLRTVVPLGDRLVLVLRDVLDGYVWKPYWRMEGDSLVIRDGGLWRELQVPSKTWFEGDPVCVEGKGYIRSLDGGLFEVSAAGATRLPTPGFCEAMAKSREGRLVASFHNVGVFARGADWERLLPSPYPQSDQRPTVTIACSSGWVVLSAEPPGEERNGVYRSRPTELWTSKGSDWVRVRLPHD